jgi:hypothetical protein
MMLWVAVSIESGAVCEVVRRFLSRLLAGLLLAKYVALDKIFYIPAVSRWPKYQNDQMSSTLLSTSYRWGLQWCIWLRHCATSWKVAGLSPSGVFGIFHWHNTFSCTMPLGLTQPLTEMSSCGGGSRYIRLTTLPPSCANCLEIWEPQPPDTLRACPGLYKDCFTF